MFSLGQTQFQVFAAVRQGIVDTGKTMKALLKHIEVFQPKMVKVTG